MYLAAFPWRQPFERRHDKLNTSQHCQISRPFNDAAIRKYNFWHRGRMRRGKPQEQSRRSIRVNSDDVLKPAVVFRCRVTLDWVAVALCYSPLMWIYFLFLTDPPPLPVWFHPLCCNLSTAEKPLRWWFVVHPNWKQPCGRSCRMLNLKRWFSLKMCSNGSNTNHTQNCSRAKFIQWLYQNSSIKSFPA